MRPQIPPDLLAVVDALRADEQLDVVLELVVRAELGRDPGPGEALPDDLPVRLQPGRPGEPERARGRDREQMRQEVARLVHDLDARLAVGNADVHVEAEDEQLADDVLKLLLEHLVALLVGDLLLLPVREGMRPGGGDPQARGPEERRERPAQPQHLLAGLADVGADLRAHLDDRLQHLRLHLVSEMRPRGGEERVDVAAQLPLGVDDLELLLDADREARHVPDPHPVRARVMPGPPRRTSGRRSPRRP